MRIKGNVYSLFCLISLIVLIGCGGDDTKSVGGAGADFDASLYYSKTDLDGGALDSRYFTETELNAGELDSRYYQKADVDGLLPSIDDTTRFLDGYDSSGIPAPFGWDSRTDSQSNETSSSYAGWTVPDNARYALFQIEINNCTATTPVSITWAADINNSAATITIHQDLFKSSVTTCFVPVSNFQGDTLYAYIGMGFDPEITYTNPISIRPVIYFR